MAETRYRCVTHNRPIRWFFVAAVCPNDIGCHVERVSTDEKLRSTEEAPNE